jgi:hypothetical protein
MIAPFLDNYSMTSCAAGCVGENLLDLHPAASAMNQKQPLDRIEMLACRVNPAITVVGD